MSHLQGASARKLIEEIDLTSRESISEPLVITPSGPPEYPYRQEASCPTVTFLDSPVDLEIQFEPENQRSSSERPRITLSTSNSRLEPSYSRHSPFVVSASRSGVSYSEVQQISVQQYVYFTVI